MKGILRLQHLWSIGIMEYRDYGVRVRDSEGNYITLTMHSVKGVVKGGLYI